MGASVPFVEAMGDAFVPEGAADVVIVLAKGVFAADYKNDIHSSQGIKSAGIAQIGKIMRGIVEINVLVVISSEEICKALHL